MKGLPRVKGKNRSHFLFDEKFRSSYYGFPVCSALVRILNKKLLRNKMGKSPLPAFDSDISIINTGCCHDCGGRCVLKAHVKEGRIIRFESDTGISPQIRACLRGRAYRQRLYSPDRLKYPLRRSGERGQGKFERITWDEALDQVAENLNRIKSTYGNSAILFLPGAGNQGLLHGPTAPGMLLQQFGGFTRFWGGPSYEGALFASMATYGTIRTGHSREDLMNSRLIILWGWNPANTIWDPETNLSLSRAKENGATFVAVDPRYTDSVATFADQWIPIRPGTDAAMLSAMAYVIITEGLTDREFLEKYTLGFDRYQEYILGKEDGEPKTPLWAEPITKVPAKVITDLARSYANQKPAALIAGWGPARTAMGEQYARSAAVLCALTGNIGIPGGNAAGFMRAYSSRETGHLVKKEPDLQVDKAKGIPSTNPVENGALPRPNSLYKLSGGTNATSARIHQSKIWDAILHGREGGYPADLKMAYIVASNCLNQYPNSNLGTQALRSLEFVVVHDQFMTPTARFADILLPVNTFMERSDIAPPWLGSPYYIYLNKAVDSLYESKSDLEISRALAPRIGVPPDFFNQTDEAILRMFASRRKDIEDFEAMKREGVLKIHLSEPVVAFKDQIADPEHHPFPTLSGKIEIHCDHLAEMNNPQIPAIPKYLGHSEHYDAPLAQKYPLQLLTTHSKIRTHSTLESVPWLKELEIQGVWINPLDAGPRRISNGDPADVFNDRGRIRITAYVTERIMPGVVNLCQGAWYTPDEEGVDIGGCANTLTLDEPSPAGAFPMNSALVQVERSAKQKEKDD
jgi:anaerobic dimethyl sulfoxide reductase subunit A